MRPRPLARTALLVLGIVAACGGGENRHSALGPTTAGGPADPVALRAILARYSPSGHAIVAGFEALPTTFVLADGAKLEFTTAQGFDDYLEDDAIANVPHFLTTGVHEMTHAYAGRLGIKLIADRALPYGDGAEAILGTGEPWLVPYTTTFPSAELDASFPADARTFRYGEYILSKDPDQSTQSQGVFGLLDELAAYYQDSRTLLDLWPWVRDEAPADLHLYLNYALLLDELRYPLAEFRLYILHYLDHARARHPDVYEALLASDGFRGALLDVLAGYAATLAAADALEPEVLAFANQRGLYVERQGDVLLLDGRPFNADEIEQYRALVAHAGEEPYAGALAALAP